MVRRPVGLRAHAADDIEQAADHYRDEAGEAIALRFVDAVELALARIGRAPLTGMLRFSYELAIPDLRAWRVGGFPYVIFYVAGVDRVDVWRVLHSRRDIPEALSEVDPSVIG